METKYHFYVTGEQVRMMLRGKKPYSLDLMDLIKTALQDDCFTEKCVIMFAFTYTARNIDIFSEKEHISA